MDDLLIVGRTKNDATIYLSELSSFTLQENGFVGAPAGLYLYEECVTPPASGIRVLAQVPDIGAAYRLLDLILGTIEASPSYMGVADPA